jgi:hypothetical protein
MLTALTFMLRLCVGIPMFRVKVRLSGDEAVGSDDTRGVVKAAFGPTLDVNVVDGTVPQLGTKE